jgi:hypothetical protein
MAADWHESRIYKKVLLIEIDSVISWQWNKKIAVSCCWLPFFARHFCGKNAGFFQCVSVKQLFQWAILGGE